MLTITKCNTIQDLIEFGKTQDISHAKLHLKSSFIDNNNTRIIVNYTSLLDKYHDHLRKIISTVTLSEEEFAKYKFQPKRLSFEIYGTTELWSMILRINNLTSASQFTMKTLKLFTMDIFDVINEILILEDDALKLNNREAGL